MKGSVNRMDFYQRLAIVGQYIPAGKVTTYGQLAMLCGYPKNSRQVGYALNRGLAGADFPAYKVVNGKGELSGAAAFPLPDMQKKLLIREGILVSADNRVDLKVYGWKNTLAEAESLRKRFEEETG